MKQTTENTKSGNWLSVGAAFAVVIFGISGCVTPTTYQAAEMAAGASGAPKIPAFLPNKSSIPQGEAMPIDGTWTVSSIGKKIRIEGGRAYAVDSWLHAFVLEVQPDMVVLQNVQRTGNGTYTAYDLPTMGNAVFSLQADGRLSAKVGGLPPAEFLLIPVAVDDPDALQQEIAMMSGGSPNIPVADGPSTGSEETGADPLAACENLGIDEETGEVVCED